jgi:hypothetical protein
MWSLNIPSFGPKESVVAHRVGYLDSHDLSSLTERSPAEGVCESSLLAAVERTWRMEDNQGQIPALAVR